MEKRNFVTSSRTPMEGASDIDDILSAGANEFGRGRVKKASDDSGDSFEKNALAEDERSNRTV